MGHEGQPGLPPFEAPAGVAFVCDSAGAVLAASRAVATLAGRSPESMRGCPLPRLAAPSEEDAVARGLAEARARGEATFSMRLPTLDGPIVDLRLHASVVGEPGSALTVCVAAPGGKREARVARAEERARRLADTHRVIGTILELALEELPLDDLLARTLDLILSIPWLSIERKGAVFLAEGEPRALVLKVMRGLDGSLTSSCARVAFGTCLCGAAATSRTAVYTAGLDDRHTTRYPGIAAHGHYCVPICADDETLGVITAYLAPGHARSEEELELLSAVANTLAGVLVRRRANEARHLAECASRAKSEFLRLVSHELLTPVSAVMLGCQRLERDAATPIAPAHAEVLCRMEAALARLASTIRMLLEHARLDVAGPPVRLETVDLAGVAGRVLEEVRRLAERKGLAVRLTLESPLPPLRTDERLLRVVLANLASNAVKFTRTGSVAVRVGYRDGAYRVAVADTGPGIPPRDRPRMFELFDPLEPLANKHVPGMGLGLALSRRLAEALGARLELEATEGPGSTFVLTLPAGAEPVAPLEPT